MQYLYVAENAFIFSGNTGASHPPPTQAWLTPTAMGKAQGIEGYGREEGGVGGLQGKVQLPSAPLVLSPTPPPRQKGCLLLP